MDKLPLVPGHRNPATVSYRRLPTQTMHFGIELIEDLNNNSATGKRPKPTGINQRFPGIHRLQSTYNLVASSSPRVFVIRTAGKGD